MKIENLKVGQIIKNYKELCNILEIKVSAGNSKKKQLNELERYCKYHKDKNKFIIDGIYDTPLPKINNNFKDFKNLHITIDQYNKKGVYKIIQDDKIYIGSTVVGFRKRFIGHKQGSGYPLPTRDMLYNGGIFKIIWIAPKGATEEKIRKTEEFYIKYYKNSKDWNCVNNNDGCNLLTKKSIKPIKYKNIKVNEKDYNRAIKILLDNNINIKNK